MKYLSLIIFLLPLEAYGQETQSETVSNLSADLLNTLFTEVLVQYKYNDTTLRRDTVYSWTFPKAEIFGNIYHGRKKGNPYILLLDSLNKIRQILYTKTDHSCHYYVFYHKKYPNYIFLYPLFSRKNYRSTFTTGIIIIKDRTYENYFIGYNSPFVFNKVGTKNVNDFQINDLFILDSSLTPRCGFRFYNKMVATYSEYIYDGYEIKERFYLLKPDYNLVLENLTLAKLFLIDKTNIDFHFKGSIDIKSHLQYPFWMLYPYYNFDSD